MLASANYALIAIMITVAVGTAGVILLLTHVITPLIFRHNRFGETKHGTYESGMDPVGDTRKRFNVRFYLVAVLFLVFDVEVVLLWPWARNYANIRDAAALTGDEPAEVAEKLAAATRMMQAGHEPLQILAAIGFFFALLLVGFAYEWRKGVFKWA